MAYNNNLLFNNVFLKNFRPTEEEMAAARYLVHGSARDWFRSADLSTPANMVETWIRPLFNQQSLDLVPTDRGDANAWSIVAPWDRAQSLAFCYVVAYGSDLDGYNVEGVLPKGQHWMIQAASLARRSGCPEMRWVVLTNGERWRLLDACSLRRYEAFLEVDLYHLLSGEDDPMAAYLFYCLLRFEGSLERDDVTGKNKLDAFVEQSLKATEATERYLKSSVSDNLNTPGDADGIMAHLCMGLVHAMDPQRTRSFTAQERDAIYRDATYLLYRLLFILYAEARGLLPMVRADYQAVSLHRVIDDAADLRLDPYMLTKRPTSLWAQLNTLFNAIQYSDEYLGVPPYNGGLFDNKDKPHLRDYAIENRFLAQALYELAFLPDPKGERPAELIDYRDLSVRHLGSLYEGMIEYKLFIAEEELLARRDKTGRVQYLSASGHERKPTDEVVQPSKVYFAQSPHERKATGTHYTAEELVERLVRHTVVRLLKERWAAFKPRLEKWLAEIEDTPNEAARARLRSHVDSQLEAFVREQILSLRICDPSMGSGHFLVFIAYTVANFILEVLTATSWDNSAVNLDPSYWRRLVVENCLYGVDINGMAVELAKLSLWLATMQPGRPLSFLDHHLKRGNSLLGARLPEIMGVLAQSDLNKQTRATALAEARGQYRFRETSRITQRLAQAIAALEKLAHETVRGVDDIARQEEDYAAGEAALAPYKEIGNLIVARMLGARITDAELSTTAHLVEAGEQESLTDKQRQPWNQAKTVLGELETVHWELTFPDVFAGKLTETLSLVPKGFDVMVGNPPFLGGLKISTELGPGLLKYLKANFPPTSGTADLSAYFCRLGFQLLGIQGFMGFVATNTISEGDTRETGLATIVNMGGIISFAEKYVKWGGDANVEVNLVGIQNLGLGDPLRTEGSAILDGRRVPTISTYLDDLPEYQPAILVQNAGKAFIGDYIRGAGFIVSSEEYSHLVSANIRNKDCLLPYLTGEDLNSDSSQAPSRYVVCFYDWDLSRASLYPALLSLVKTRVKPQRDMVRQERDKEKWWLFARYRKALREATRQLEKVIARSRVSELHQLAFVQAGVVSSDATVVFAYDDFYHFALLQSCLHEIWLRRQASSLRTDVRYTPSDCFQTFPFPQTVTNSCRNSAEEASRHYYDHRQQLLAANGWGLTKTAGLFHDPGYTATAIEEMRWLHAEIDQTTLACYGWQDIKLDHDFYHNDRKKIRFMPSPEAQREVFIRLIALNQEIAAQEADAGIMLAPETFDEEQVVAPDDQ